MLAHGNRTTALTPNASFRNFGERVPKLDDPTGLANPTPKPAHWRNRLEDFRPFFPQRALVLP